MTGLGGAQRLAVLLGFAAAFGGCGKKGNDVVPDPAASTSATAMASTEIVVPKAASAHVAASAHSAEHAQNTEHAPVPKRLTPIEAEQVLSEAAAEFKRPQRSCAKVANGWAMAYTAADMTSPSQALKEATYAAARCFEATEHWDYLKVAGAALDKMDPSTEKYAFVPRALLGLDQDKNALNALVEIDKKHPNEPEVLFTAALVLYKNHLWAKLGEAADASAKAADLSHDKDTKEFSWRARIFREVADLNLGKLAEAERDINAVEKAGAPPAMVTELRKELVPMKATKIGIDVKNPAHIFLGTYHLFGRAKELGELFNVSFVNFSGKDQVLKVETEVPGISDRMSKSVTLLNGKSEFVRITPPLRADFKPQNLTAERTASFAIKVTTGDGKTVFEDTRQVTVYPRDQFPRGEQGSNVIGAWVTPQVAAIEEFMTAAKKRMTSGSLEGSLGATMPQVKALYDELHARGMTYVLQSDMGYNVPQHVRLPADAIKSTNALCLDGAVVFATLMEKIGLKPILVFVPGHAFVGWHAEPKDEAPAGTIYWLETTMVGTAPFEVAVRTAAGEYKKHSESHVATLIDIKAVRERGITPQPWD